MAEMKTKKRNPKYSKEKILLTAEKLFAQKGVSVSVDTIAKQSGLNKRMIYHYFGSKAKLWEAVLERQYQKVADVESRISANQDLSEMICDLIERYYNFLATDKYFVKLLMYENLQEGRTINKLSVGRTKFPIIKQLEYALEHSDIKEFDCQNLLIDCIALCFFYFSNQATLSALFGENFSSDANIKKRIEHIKQVFSKIIKG